MQAEHVLCGFSVMTMIDNDEFKEEYIKLTYFHPLST